MDGILNGENLEKFFFNYINLVIMQNSASTGDLGPFHISKDFFLNRTPFTVEISAVS